MTDKECEEIERLLKEAGVDIEAFYRQIGDMLAKEAIQQYLNKDAE